MVCSKNAYNHEFNFEKLTAALRAINPDVTKNVLQEELLDLAKLWDIIKLGRLEDYEYSDEEYDDAESDSESETQNEFVGNIGSTEHRSHCRKCPACVF